MIMPLIRNAMFLVIGLVLVHAANAKTITEKDIHEYMQDPIFVDLWFGIYDFSHIDSLLILSLF